MTQAAPDFQAASSPSGPTLPPSGPTLPPFGPTLPPSDPRFEKLLKRIEERADFYFEERRRYGRLNRNLQLSIVIIGAVATISAGFTALASATSGWHTFWQGLTIVSAALSTLASAILGKFSYAEKLAKSNAAYEFTLRLRIDLLLRLRRPITDEEWLNLEEKMRRELFANDSEASRTFHDGAPRDPDGAGN
ncbi:MAG: hypothetical protein ACK5YI_06315 [Rhodospirillales bacterium]|jgi:hypothetical protein